MSLQRKKNKIVAVFAHPDDESLGPGGTLAKLSKDNEICILCATYGDAHGDLKLGKTRSKELQNSAKILGVSNVEFLGFSDGTLSNNIYHELAKNIEEKLQRLKPEVLITFEPRGVSGHIDHITVSLITTYVFYKLPFIKELLYYCISQDERNLIKNYFIYFPPGYKKGEIDEIFQVADVWDQKVKAMFAHRSQINDVKKILKMQEKLPKEEYFLVLNK